MTYPPPPAAEPTQPGWAPDPPAPVLEARVGAGVDVRGDVRAALVLAAAVAGLGALLGLVWAAWSPPGPRALVLAPGVRQPDETESFVAGDGRFLVISVVVGVVTAVVAWRWAARRGPWVLAALAVGGLAGSLLMELVGHLTGGGTFDGLPNTLIEALPLSLHMQGLLFLEAGAATLVYGMFVAFAVRDDLGRPDPIRESLVPAPASVSVGPGDHPQYGRGYGDAPGALQQRDLPPQ